MLRRHHTSQTWRKPLEQSETYSRIRQTRSNKVKTRSSEEKVARKQEKPLQDSATRSTG